jgi:uncharacterized protein (DUF2336 family)
MTVDALLDDLQALAREKSREQRSKLLRRLTDLFFKAGGRHDDRVLDLFEDVICRVLAEVDMRARMELSDRMSMAPAAPHRVVRALADDEPPVAEPVLRHSSALTEADLMDIASRKGVEHLAVMSRRIYLSEAITDTLIERGNTEVHRALAGNDGAQITGDGYARLLTGARRDQVLQELMALRSNLPATVRHELVPMLASEVRRRVLARIAERADPVIEEALDAEMANIMERVDDMSRDRLAYADLQVAFDEGSLTLDEAIRQACRLDRHDWVVDLLAFAGPLDRSRAMQALLEKDPKPIAVVMKAQGLSPDTFRTVLDMRAKHLRIGTNNPKLVDDYAGLDVDVAHTVLRHLRARIENAA